MCCVEHPCHMVIARALWAPAASVSKQHNRAGILRQPQSPIERDETGCNANQTLFNQWTCRRDHLATLYREGEGLRHFARFPFRSRLERFDRPRLVEVEHRVELIWQACMDLLPLPLGLGTIDHSNRALEAGH